MICPVINNKSSKTRWQEFVDALGNESIAYLVNSRSEGKIWESIKYKTKPGPILKLLTKLAKNNRKAAMQMLAIAYSDGFVKRQLDPNVVPEDYVTKYISDHDLHIFTQSDPVTPSNLSEIKPTKEIKYSKDKAFKKEARKGRKPPKRSTDVMGERVNVSIPIIDITKFNQDDLIDINLDYNSLSLSSFNKLDDLQTEQNIVNSLVSMTLKKIDRLRDSGKPVTISNALQEISDELVQEYEFFDWWTTEDIDAEALEQGALPTAEANEVMANNIKFILDNFNPIKLNDKLVYVGFGFKIADTINRLKFNITDEILEEQNVIEKNYFQDGFSFKQDPEKSVSAQIKRMLAFIPKTDENGNEIANALGYKIYEDYNKVYNTLLELLAGAPIEDMMPLLEENAVSNPMLQQVVTKLQELKVIDSATYNKFFSVFKRQRNNFKFTRINTGGTNEQLTFSIFDANRFGAADVVLNSWHENFKTKGLKSGLIKKDKVNNVLTIDTKKGKELYNRFIETYNEDYNEALENINTLLSEIGIDLNENVLKDINADIRILNRYKHTKRKYNNYYNQHKLFKDFVQEELSYIFITLAGGVSENTEENWQVNNPFYSQNRRIKGLASYNLKYTPTVTSSSFKNGNGDSVYGFSTPSHMSNRMYELNNNQAYKESLLGLPMVKACLDSNNTPVLGSWLNGNTKLYYSDSTKNARSFQKAKQYNEQTPKERAFTRLGNFQKAGNPLIYGNTPSDKGTFPLFEVERFNLKQLGNICINGVIDVNKINLYSKEVTSLYSILVQSEINRINTVASEFNNNKIEDLIPGYHYVTDKKTGKKVLGSGGYFFFLPQLNEVAKQFRNKDGSLTIGSSHDVFAKAMLTEIKKLAEDKVRIWENYGITNFKEGTNRFDKTYASKLKTNVNVIGANQNVITIAALDMVTNYLVSNANEFMFVTGDPALFTKANYKFTSVENLIKDTSVSIFKRAAKDIAPGVEGNFESPSFNTIFIEEPTVNSVLSKYTNRINKTLAKGYTNLEGADAQEWTTLKEHLNVLYAYGKISKDIRDSLIDKANKRLTATNKAKYNFTWAELGTILQPLKPVYVGSTTSETDFNVDLHYYIKTSSYPLIPQLTEDMEIDKLRVAMETNNIDRAVAHSGVKIGYRKGLNIFDGNTVNVDNITKGIHTLSRNGFRIQQEIPFDPVKESHLEASQLRKIKFANLTTDLQFDLSGVDKSLSGYELKKLDDKIHNIFYQRKFTKLLTQLGVVENFKIKDAKKLKEILVETAQKLDYSYNDLLLLNTIQIDEDTSIFDVPLWFHNSGDRIESMLNSIITNRVLKNELPGKSFVQGSSIGFVPTVKDESFLDFLQQFTNQKIAFTKHYNGEQLDYREYTENGKKVIYAEVFMPFNFLGTDNKGHKTPLNIKDYVDSSGFIKEDKIDEELFNVLGYRIPTQGHNSMIKMKVVGFLPQEAGDLIIVPAAITNQMGSDFDVDKLYTHWYNYEVKDGKLTKISSPDHMDLEKYSDKQLQNLTMDITYSILSNETVQNKYQFMPIDAPDLKADKEYIKKIKKQSKKEQDRINPYKTSILSDEYQGHIVEVNSAGKVGIGAYSTASVNHILFQYAGVYLSVPTNKKGEIMPEKTITVQFKDENGNIYTDNKDDEDFVKNRVNNLSDMYYYNTPSKGAWRLDKVYTFPDSTGKRKTISEVISYYQSAAVDNANEQDLYDLHQNKDTFRVTSLIARAGFDERFIDRFINQPIIIEYVKQLANLYDFTSSTYEANKLENLRTSIFNKYGVKNYKSLKIKAPSLKEMEEAIKNGGQDKQFQAQILYNFIKYSEIAANISSIQNAINVDTSFLGKSMYSSILKDENIDTLINQGTIGNASNLIIGTTQGGAINYGLRASLNLFSGNNLYPTNLDFVKTIMAQISKQLNLDLNESIVYSIMNDLRSAFYTEAISKVFNEDIESLRSRLLYGTKTESSLAKRLHEFQQTSNNIFINNLSSKLSYDGQSPDLVELNSSKEVFKEIEFDMLLGWNELLNSNPDSKEYKLGIDLVYYTLLNGNQNTATSFSKLLPYDFITEKTGLSKYYRKLYAGIDNSIDLAVSNFATQWIQHNPYRAPQTTEKQWKTAVDFEGKAISRGKIPDIIVLKSAKDKETSSLYTETKEGMIPPKFLCYVQGKNVGLYKLYNNKYTRIPSLSKNRLLKQYNLNNAIQKDIFSQEKDIRDKIIKINNTPIEGSTSNKIFAKYNFDKGIKSVLETISKKSDNPTYQKIAEYYLKNINIIKDYNFEIFDVKKHGHKKDTITNAPLGRIMYSSQKIAINDIKVNTETKFIDTVLHELTHAFLREKIGTTENNELKEIIRRIMTKHKDKLSDVKWLKSIGVEQVNSKGWVYKDYAFIKSTEPTVVYNTTEFASFVMSNKDMQLILSNLKVSRKRSFLEKFKDIVLNILGLSTDKYSALEESMYHIIKAIESNSVPNPKPSKKLTKKQKIETEKKSTYTIPKINLQFSTSTGQVEEQSTPKEKPSVIPQIGLKFSSNDLIDIHSFTNSKPNNKHIKEAIVSTDSNGLSKYIPFIQPYTNRRWVTNNFFRYSEDKKPYYPYSTGNVLMDKQLVTEINNYFDKEVVYYSATDKVLKFNPNSESAINQINTEESKVNSEWEDLDTDDLIDYDSIDSVEEVINRQKTTIKVLRKKLTEKGIDRSPLQTKISILTENIKKLEKIQSQENLEKVLTTTVDSIEQELDSLVSIVDNKLNDDDLELTFKRLEELDLYLTGVQDVDLLLIPNTDEERARYLILGDRARQLKTIYRDVQKNVLTQYYSNSSYNTDVDLFKDIEDINYAVRTTTGLSESNSPLVRMADDVLHKMQHNINEAQVTAASKINLELKLLQKATGKKGEELFEPFLQKDKQGNWTGNYIGRYSQEFYDTKTKLWLAARNKKVSWKYYFGWLHANSHFITEQELTSGTSKYYSKEVMLVQKELLKHYEADKKAYFETLEDNPNKEVLKTIWENLNSPYLYAQQMNSGAYNNAKGGKKYLVKPIPISKWKDPNFDKILQNKDLHRFYNFMVDTINSNNKYLPYEEHLPSNYLPEVSKTFLEKISNKGLMKGVRVLGPEIMHALTSEVEGVIDYENSIMGKVWKPIQTRMMYNKLTTNNKSKDIGKVLKLHSAMTNAYIYKSKAEPVLNAIQQSVENLGEIDKKTTTGGKITVRDVFGKTKIKENKLVNTRAQLEYAIEALLYGNYRKTEGRFGKVFLTEKEKIIKKDLDTKLKEGKISKKEYEDTVYKLGRQVSATSISDTVSKYTYLNALGFPNVITPAVNLTFGIASNFIYAAGNEDTSLKSMRKAIRIFLKTFFTSVGRKQQGNKMWAFMEYLGVLDDFNESLYGQSATLADKMLFLQNDTERMNRGILMLSILLHNKLKDKNNNSVSIYDAFKFKDGTVVWDTEKMGEQEEVPQDKIKTDKGINLYRLKRLIERTNQHIHGDYESVLESKKTILGRSVMMFKTWMPLAVLNRFRKTEYDEQLQRVVKGRYRVLFNAKDVEGKDLSPKEVLRIIAKAAFKKNGLNALSEVDRAAVKRNLKELQFMVQFTLAILALSSIDTDDDEEQFVTTLLINFLTKAQADLSFFTDPSAMAQVVNNVVPVYTTVNNIFKITDVAWNIIEGQPTYEAGPHRGQNRALLWAGKIIPGVSGGIRMFNYGDRIYNYF